MPSAFWRSVASEMLGRPRSFFFSATRCGARMTQPVWPDQCSASRRASLSGRNGSPALPKMLSTKSRLLTRLPGAKNRTSIDFSGETPGTSGARMGRSSRETKTLAGFSLVPVKGSVMISRGGVSEARSRRAKVSFGTDFLSAGTGRPPSATWKTPSVVRRSLAGL